MVFTRLLRRLHGRERALPIRKRPQTFRPQFEQLEPRQMLSAASLTNVALAPPAIFAGSQTTLSGNVTAFDGGATLSIDWGDGTAAQTAQVGAASSQISQSHVYADEGSYVASIQSADTAPARLSTSSTGTQANGASYSVSISGDGRYVAFSSQAKNLVPDDPNYGPDVFVRDRLDGTTTRVSVGSSVKFGTNPSISADGRYVVFSGSALNLPGHTGNEPEVWLYDRDTEQTTLISNYWDINGEGLFPQSFFPVISADGRYVAFTSNGAHLANINTDSSVYNVFLYDRVTGVMTSVTDQLENMGTRADGNSYVKSISADGRYVVFESDADNLVDIASLGGDTNNKRDVFVFDRETGTTTRISVDAHNNQLDTFSQGGSISGDGHYIVFTSTAGDLVSPSTTAPNDILLYDAQTRSTARVSVAPDGTPADHASYNAAISADGRFVTFSSAADNLVLGGDTNGVADIFIKDLSSGAIRRLSTGASGQGDGRSGVPVISADAHFVAFLSAAKNLVLGDTNEYQDAFVADAMPLTATASVTVTSASPGSLDAPFGNGGVVVTNNGGEVYDMAIQPVDGKIIVVGNGFQVVRYNTDGTLDRVFNNAGLADQTATSVAVDAQNRILVTGYGNGDFTLVRYNPNGTVDTSFGSGGVVSTQFGPGGANAWSVAIDAQGRIVVAGDAIGTAAGDTDFVVARYNSDGTLDTSFGIGGQVTTDFPNINSTDSALNVVLDAEGRILLVGTSSAGDDTGEAYTALARYNPNGTLDTSFGTGGLVTTNFADGWESATSAAIDGQGRIVVSSTGNFWDFAVARYTADGTLDTSFGSGGLMVRDLGGLDQSFGVAIDNLGRIVVAGKTSDASGDKLAIVRLKDDGTLDQSFANGGVATPDIGYSRANTVAIDAQGRIVAAGYDAIGPDFSTRGFAVARFLADV